MKAVLKNYRQSPRKVRLVTNLIKGKRVDDAMAYLAYANKRAGGPISKLLESAVANAKARDIDTTNLIVKDARVDAGATLKRARPRSRGMSSPIKKRTSQVTLELAQGEMKKPKVKASKKK